MEIREVRGFEGPNVHSHHPVIEMKVDLGEYEGRPTNELEGFNEQLLASLPTLREHHCSRGHPGGFCERLAEGTLLGHVIEHVALELQALAGCDVIYGKTRRVKGGLYNVVYEHTCFQAGERAGRRAVDLATLLLDGRLPPVADAVDDVRRLTAEHGLGPSTDAICRAARVRGIPVTRLGHGSWLVLGYGRHQRRVCAGMTGRTSALGVDLACDKTLTKSLLALAGIAVPAGEVVTTAEEAMRAARRIGFPVAVKPLDGNQGNGVSLNIRSAREVRTAFTVARRFGARVIVERCVSGRQYRVLVVGGRVVAAAERIPARVTGDGRSTVAELIERENADARRGYGHERPLTRMRVDDVARLLLRRAGYDVSSVPGPGESVYLRENANLSTGGTSVDVTAHVHPDVAEACRRAAAVIGLDVAGVDLVVPDISRPLEPGGWAVIEVNASPGLRMHHFPAQGGARDAAGAIVDALFPAGTPRSVPVAAVTGTNGKTTTARLLAHLLSRCGLVVGLATTDGVDLGDRRLIAGDCSGPRSARGLLLDPEIEAVVLETARGGILREGLAFETCQVAVVTNIGPDHLGQDGVETLEDLVDVKSLVVEAVARDGTAVLNADNPLVLGMARRARGRVALFSHALDNLAVRRHLADGGDAVWVRGGWVVWSQAMGDVRLCPVEEVAMAWGGAAPHNLENALAAAAAALSLGVPPAVAADALRNWTQNQGRLEVHRVAGRSVVVDYGHNPSAITATLRCARALGRELIAVLGVPGDRRDDLVAAAGRAAGALCDRAVVKEDRDRRGRPPGEIAGLLLDGLVRGGLDGGRTEVVLEEGAAVERAVRRARPGDVVVVFFERRQVVLEALHRCEAALDGGVAAPRPSGAGQPAAREAPPRDDSPSEAQRRGSPLAGAATTGR